HLHDRRRKTMREQWRNAADRADLSLDIVEREIALGRRIEFENPWNRKACLERLPDIAAQAIAARHPQPVLALERGGLCFQEIAAELADILEKGAIEARDVLPEMAGREFVGKCDGRPREQHAAGRNNAADRVIDRQAIVETIVRRRVG